MSLKTKGVPLQAVPADGKLNPLFAIESRPCSFYGLGWWAVLSYKEHNFEERLPLDFMAMDETGQNLAIAPIAQRLREKLRPILEAEDAAEAEAVDDPRAENARGDQ